jgi:hypothetical protein
MINCNIDSDNDKYDNNNNNNNNNNDNNDNYYNNNNINKIYSIDTSVATLNLASSAQAKLHKAFAQHIKLLS